MELDKMTCEMCGDPAVRMCEMDGEEIEICKGCCKSYKKFITEIKEKNKGGDN